MSSGMSATFGWLATQMALSYSSAANVIFTRLCLLISLVGSLGA